MGWVRGARWCRWRWWQAHLFEAKEKADARENKEPGDDVRVGELVRAMPEEHLLRVIH